MNSTDRDVAASLPPLDVTPESIPPLLLDEELLLEEEELLLEDELLLVEEPPLEELVLLDEVVPLEELVLLVHVVPPLEVVPDDEVPPPDEVSLPPLEDVLPAPLVPPSARSAFGLSPGSAAHAAASALAARETNAARTNEEMALIWPTPQRDSVPLRRPAGGVPEMKTVKRSILSPKRERFLHLLASVKGAGEVNRAPLCSLRLRQVLRGLDDVRHALTLQDPYRPWRRGVPSMR